MRVRMNHLDAVRLENPQQFTIVAQLLQQRGELRAIDLCLRA